MSKNWKGYAITAVLTLLMAVGLLAQSGGQFSVVIPVGALTSCPSPVVNANIVCSVTDGVYVSNSGGAYTKLGTGSSTTTLPFTSITGQMTPAQLPASASCAATATGTVGATGGFVGTIKISSCGP